MSGAFNDPKFVELIAKLVAMLGASDVEVASARNLLQRQLRAKGLNVTDLAEYLKSTGSVGNAQLERDLRRARDSWHETQRQYGEITARNRVLEQHLRSALDEREEAVLSRDKLTRDLAAVLMRSIY
jgi:hypothetical protein